MDMHMALLLTTLAGLSTGLGGLVVWLMRTPGPRIMALSQGFAAGVMMTVSLSEMLPSAVEAYAASGAAPVGAALRCASLCAAGMLAALLLEKSLPEDEALGTASFRARQNACSSPARGACHHGGHRAAQFARGHPYAVHQRGRQRPGPVSCTGHCPAQYPGGHCGGRTGLLRHAQPHKKPFVRAGLRPGRTGGRPGGLLSAAGLLLASVSERPAGAGGGREAAGVSLPSFLQAAFPMEKTAPALWGWPWAPCVWVWGFTLCNAAQSGIMPCV